MLTLTKDTKLQVVLAGAVAANECPIVVEFEEGASDVRRVTRTADSITTGATAVDVLTVSDAPKRIKSFSFYNADTSSVVVTVRFYNANGTTRVVRKQTLLTLEGLHWNEAQGWHSVDANGNRKGNSASTDTAVSSQASSIAAAIVPASINSVSSQASSIAAVNPHTVSTNQSGASAQSFTSTTWSTVSSATSRVKSSFTW
jgi:hypothetical protein